MGTIKLKLLRLQTAKSSLLYLAIIALVLVTACTLSADSGSGKKNSAEANSNNLPVAVYKGHNLPRLRGAMVSPTMVTEEDLRVLGKEWHANLVRWQLNWAPWNDKNYDATDLKKYDDWLEMEMTRLDRFLPICKKYGLKVVIDLHTPPGSGNGTQHLMFVEKRYQDKLAEVWERIARRYKGNNVVWAYDLVNEPVEGTVAKGLYSWQELAEITAQKIRVIDSEHAIIFEPSPWGNPEGLKHFKPLSVPGVIYSVHMYQPHDFTHQGTVGKDMSVRLAYPGTINKRMWNKEELRRTLLPVIEFQKKNGVHIYIGEFGAIRWAPGNSAFNYLKDLIEIFEENDWDWSYHAFREWHGWNVEFGPDQKDEKRVKSPTDREKLFRKWFGQNLRP